MKKPLTHPPLSVTEPNEEMRRLREMLDSAGIIEWHDSTDNVFCRTYGPSKKVGKWKYSAVCGDFAYGTIELWTQTMREKKLDPIGLDTAEEAFELIKQEVGE